MGLTKKWGSGIVKNCQDVGDAEPFGPMVFRIPGGGFEFFCVIVPLVMCRISNNIVKNL